MQALGLEKMDKGFGEYRSILIKEGRKENVNVLVG